MLQLLKPLKNAWKQQGSPAEVADKHENVAQRNNLSPAEQSPADHAAPTHQGKVMKFSLSNGDKPLSGYTIKRGVGIGGFGEVYFAVNDAGKEVALKRIQRNLDIEVRGVRQCLNLKHPNLIGLYDIQFDEHQQGWIVMEYVSGPSLRDMVDGYPTGMPVADVRNWFAQIASGVTYLHDHGIVHRDLKPANIFTDEGIVKIGDYGLSKFISCSRRGGQTESVGTFHYMAPEIGKGEYGKEIDIYALGIILYEMATGCVPFDGESSQEIIMKHLTADPDLSRVASPVREVVGKALQKNASHRFSDVREMIGALGMELDQRYLVIDRQVALGSASASLPPVIEPIPLTYAMPGGAQGAPKAKLVSDETQAKLRYEEPIARAVRVNWRRVANAWNNNNLAPGARGALIAVIVIMCILNLGPIMAVAVTLGAIYLPYYIVWAIVMGGSKCTKPQIHPAYNAVTVAHKQSPPVVQPVAKPVAKPGPAVRPPAPKPLSIKQWKVAKRKQLAMLKPSMLGAEVTSSWIGSAIVIAVFTSLVGIFQVGSGTVGQPYVIGMIWSAIMAFVCSMVAITLSKRWQASEGDAAVRCFVQLTLGLGIGAIAYGLSEFLMVPWTTIAHDKFGDLPVQRWRGFFADDNAPLLAAYLAYFPLLMGLVHWWKQADPLRRTRFSLFSVLWTLLMAGIVQLIIPFPQPWGALVFAGTSIAVQMSTPWVNSDERLETAV